MRRRADFPHIDIHLDRDTNRDEREPDEIEVERLDPVFRAWLERGTVGAR